jgi:AcrR family transcriptional regulator
MIQAESMRANPHELKVEFRMRQWTPMTNSAAAPDDAPSPFRRSPTQERSERRTERILQATVDLLAHTPPDALTTTRIAKAAEISVGSIYRYFADVDAILNELLQRSEAELLVYIRTGFSLVGDDWPDAVSRAMDLQVEFLQNHQTGFHSLWFSTTGALAERTLLANRRTDDALTDELIAELPADKLERLGANARTVVRLAVGILTAGTELAFSATNSQGDPVVVAETKLAATLYLSAYLG